MSVFIPGMDFPKGCRACRFYIWNGEDDYACLISDYNEPCPLVDVKTPHGRLIDADALKEELAVAGIILTYGTQICQKINNAKTIIEAEGQE